MTGEITFYSNGPAPRRNAIIENIDDFLIQRGLSRTINFPRISLRMNIKLTADQTGNYIENVFLGNYCKIVVDDGTFYFFIENVIQVNPNTADLSLRMDTLNTYEGRYGFSSSSRTLRRHKDRFTRSARPSSMLNPVFDDKDEGVFPPLRKYSDVAIRQSGESAPDPIPSWYKVIYSYADAGLNTVHNKVAVVGNSGVADYESDIENFLYSTTHGAEPNYDYPILTLQSIVRTAQEYIKVSRVPYCPFNVTVSKKTITPGGGGTPFTASVYAVSGVDAYYNDDVGYIQLNEDDTTTPHLTLDVNSDMLSIPLLDQHFIMPRVLLGEAQPMMSNNYYVKNDVSTEEVLDLTIWETNDLLSLETEAWDYIPDPKIYTSPYYQVRFSFLEDFFLVAFEDLKCTPANTKVRITLSQYVSTNLDADVMFKGSLYGAGISFKRQLTDYPYLFNITSKTEMPLISDAYINYMRNGYNYDVAQQKRSIINSWVGTGIKAVGSIASIAIGGIGAVAGVALLTSSASSIYSNVSSAQSGEEEIERRVKGAAAQSPTVSTMDSGLNWLLNDGLVHKTVYKADDDVLASINRFFHLFGYVTDEIGDPTPFFHTRKWFNFVMGEYIIEAGEYIEHQYIEELERRYKEGVTIYHWDELNDTWNYEQDLFNTELSLLE